MAPITCTYDVSNEPDPGDPDYEAPYDDDATASPSGDPTARRRLASTLPNYCYIVVATQLCLPILVPYNATCLECPESGSHSSDCDLQDMISVCLFDSSTDGNMFYQLAKTVF